MLKSFSTTYSIVPFEESKRKCRLRIKTIFDLYFINRPGIGTVTKVLQGVALIFFILHVKIY